MVSAAQTPLSLSRPGVSDGRALPSSWFSFGAGGCGGLLASLGLSVLNGWES